MCGCSDTSTLDTYSSVKEEYWDLLYKEEQEPDAEEFDWKKQEEKYANKHFRNIIGLSPTNNRLFRQKRFKQKIRINH